MPDHETLTALKAYGNGWILADPRGTYSYCANAVHNVCNWLVLANSPEQFCVACRHNRVIPDLSQLVHREHWRLIEIAKHRLSHRFNWALHQASLLAEGQLLNCATNHWQPRTKQAFSLIQRAYGGAHPPGMLISTPANSQSVVRVDSAVWQQLPVAAAFVGIRRNVDTGAVGVGWNLGED